MRPPRTKPRGRGRAAARRRNGGFRPGNEKVFNCDTCGQNFAASKDRKPYHTETRRSDTGPTELKYWMCPECSKRINGKDIYR